jgi:carbamoylphosphate synthase small subunit
MEDPNKINLVAEVSSKAPQMFNTGGNVKITMVDCGMKLNQLRCMVSRGAAVKVVPWDHDFGKDSDWDGLFLSNGPGDPQMASKTIENLRAVFAEMQGGKRPVKPIFGICLGHQVKVSTLAQRHHPVWFGTAGISGISFRSRLGTCRPLSSCF